MNERQTMTTESGNGGAGSQPAQGADIQHRARQVALATPEGFLAFGFGAGLLTRAPGTMGTLAAVPIALLLGWLDWNGILFLLVAFLAGVWLCQRTTDRLGVEDYGGIVWDEMVAYWLVVAFIPYHWAWYLAGFVLFRAFDILKPWPISLVEEHFDGGWGIMLDDVGAAVYTMLVLQFIDFWILR
jgi:phosphatidylglycerophosphatase A